MKRILFIIVFFLFPLFSVYGDPIPVYDNEHILAQNADGAGRVVVVDLDTDGDMDFLAALKYEKKVVWGENDGLQNFISHIIDNNFRGATSVKAVDFDGDGDLDVFGAAYTANEIAWWENDGSMNFTKHIIGDSLLHAFDVCVKDIDSDGDLDVVGAAIMSDLVAWWENDGNQNLTEHIITSNFGGAGNVDAADLDGDGDIDILGAAKYADKMAWWENDGNQNFIEHIIDGFYDNANCILAVDFDNDGDMDVMGAAKYGDEITWWENDGNQNFTKHTIGDNFDGAFEVYPADLDSDGDLDAVATAIFADEIAWWENSGDNLTFTKHLVVENFDAARSVYPADIDGDGDIDLMGAALDDDEIAWWESDLFNIYSDIDMAPESDPLIVTPGNIFNYTGSLTNKSDRPITFDILVGVETPEGVFDSLKFYTDIYLEPDSSTSAFLTQYVPATAPIGTYEYIAYSIDSDFSIVSDSASFTLILDAGDSPLGASPYGWDIEGKWGASYNNNVSENQPETPVIVSAYPNPFNANTEFSFDLWADSKVCLMIYDLLGRKVETLINERLPVGIQRINWDASEFPSGIYLYKLQVDNNVNVGKISLVK